ncbi:MAG: endonuclease [Candidatus Marinimicrobia bacterium]|nr:endonuclease [Candidatus Neomarinimicrobiota bacterium]
MKKYFLMTIIFLFGVNNFAQTIAPGLISDSLFNYIREHYTTTKTLGYTRCRDTMYAKIDNVNDSLTCIYTGYTKYLNPAVDPSASAYDNTNGDPMDCEHSWPKSKGAEKEPALSDMHHLFPSRSNVNSARSNEPFGEVPDSKTDKWYWLDLAITTKPTENIDLYSEDCNEDTLSFEGVFEPREGVKGDIARAQLYFFTIYNETADTSFWSFEKNTMLQWHRQDPVDEKELTRTWAIARYQDSLPNPFVIDSTLAQRLWPMETSLEKEADIAHGFILHEAYPNPFNPKTHIRFELSKSAFVQLEIFDLRGNAVETLKKGFLQKNAYTVTWDAGNYPTGLYIVRFSADDFQQYKKCLLIK